MTAAADFQIIAEARVVDAQVLLAAERWSTAYYLLGYAVECALKACAAKQFHEHELPEKTFVNTFYTHELSGLLNISGIKPELEKRTKSDPAFERNWSNVKNSWKVDSRYEHLTTEAEARSMLFAVNDPATGVLPWLKTQW